MVRAKQHPDDKEEGWQAETARLASQREKDTLVSLTDWPFLLGRKKGG